MNRFSKFIPETRNYTNMPRLFAVGESCKDEYVTLLLIYSVFTQCTLPLRAVLRSWNKYLGTFGVRFSLFGVPLQ
jgi:hypothetical protein